MYIEHIIHTICAIRYQLYDIWYVTCITYHILPGLWYMNYAKHTRYMSYTIYYTLFTIYHPISGGRLGHVFWAPYIVLGGCRARAMQPQLSTMGRSVDAARLIRRLDPYGYFQLLYKSFLDIGWITHHPTLWPISMEFAVGGVNKQHVHWCIHASIQTRFMIDFGTLGLLTRSHH